MHNEKPLKTVRYSVSIAGERREIIEHTRADESDIRLRANALNWTLKSIEYVNENRETEQ